MFWSKSVLFRLFLVPSKKVWVNLHLNFLKPMINQRDVRASSRRTKRRDSRDNEKVELWVLAPKEKK